MRVYLAGPNNQLQARVLEDMPALLSFAYYPKWMEQWHPSFSRVLIDSGAFSELNSGKKIDAEEYREWSERWQGHADAIAGLDDIRGDWKRSLRNYEHIPWTFPVWHETDPWELLPDLVAMARERCGWLGIGLLPPRNGKEQIIRDACKQIPEGIHVHGFALRAYTHIRRLDSVDSTNWFLDTMKIRRDLPWLTYGECAELVVKRYKRWKRRIIDEEQELFQ